MTWAKRLAVLALLLAPIESEGRVGGGHSYGGGGEGGGSRSSNSGWNTSSRDSSRSSSGTGSIDPVILFSFLAVFLVASVLMTRSATGNARSHRRGLETPPTYDGDTGHVHSSHSTVLGSFRQWAAKLFGAPPPRGGTRGAAAVSSNVMTLQHEEDPAFSRFVFDEFLTRLFTRVHSYRTEGGGPFAPWLGPDVRATLSSVSLSPVSDVAVRSVTLEDFSRSSYWTKATVVYEALLRDTTGAAQLTTQRWTLRRPSRRASHPPEAMLALGCPACGATNVPEMDGVCTACKANVLGEHSGWVVTSILVESTLAVLPLDRPVSLGTVSSTVSTPALHPDLPVERRMLESRCRDHSWPAFVARVREVFVTVQDARGSGNVDRHDPALLAMPMEALLFERRRLEAEGFRREITSAELTRVEVAQVYQEPFFDVIVVWIQGEVREVVLATTDRLVGGHPQTARLFSEYWTFIRRSGAFTNAPGEPSVVGRAWALARMDAEPPWTG